MYSKANIDYKENYDIKPVKILFFKLYQHVKCPKARKISIFTDAGNA